MKTPSLAIKRILLLTVCFYLFKPSANAQRVNLDQKILIGIMNNRTHDGVKFYRGISNSTQMVSVLVPVTVLAAGVISNDKLTMKKGLTMVESVAGATFISYGMKYSFRRTRPFIKNPDIIAAGSGGSPSFPSGHTSVAFAAATSLTLAYPKWYVAVPAFAWASAVGYSRMYLGVHYPSDVAVGAFIGVGSAWLMHKANKWLFEKKAARR